MISIVKLKRMGKCPFFLVDKIRLFEYYNNIERKDFRYV